MITANSKEQPFDNSTWMSRNVTRVLVYGNEITAVPLIKRIAKSYINLGMKVAFLGNFHITLDTPFFFYSYEEENADFYIYFWSDKFSNPEIYFNQKGITFTDAVLADTSDDIQWIKNRQHFTYTSACSYTKAQENLQMTDWLVIRHLEKLLMPDHPLHKMREEFREEAGLIYNNLNEATSTNTAPIHTETFFSNEDDSLPNIPEPPTPPETV